MNFCLINQGRGSILFVMQIHGKTVKIWPKTKDWLKGLQEEIARKRDSMAPMSPTANSCLLEENFDFSSLDYDSEGVLI